MRRFKCHCGTVTCKHCDGTGLAFDEDGDEILDDGKNIGCEWCSGDGEVYAECQLCSDPDSLPGGHDYERDKEI